MPRLLERAIKVRDTFKIRKQPSYQSQSQPNVFNTAKQRMDAGLSRIQERKPQFLSQANEALGGWQPGSRITKIMPVDFGKRSKRLSTKKESKELDFSMSVQST